MTTSEVIHELKRIAISARSTQAHNANGSFKSVSDSAKRTAEALEIAINHLQTLEDDGK